MKILICIIILLGIILVIRGLTKSKEKLSLAELTKKTFSKHVIIEKFSTVMICEINHRNEPDELIFIRITPNKAKEIKKMGRRLIANYPKQPTAKEMKKDFKAHLKL